MGYENVHGCIFTKFWTEINFWKQHWSFESLPGHQNTVIGAVNCHSCPKSRNGGTILQSFPNPGGPFEITNGQISISAVHILFSGFIAVLIASQTTFFVFNLFVIFSQNPAHFNPDEVDNRAPSWWCSRLSSICWWWRYCTSFSRSACWTR